MAEKYEDAKIKRSNYILELSLSSAANSDRKASAGLENAASRALQLPGTSKSLHRCWQTWTVSCRGYLALIHLLNGDYTV